MSDIHRFRWSSIVAAMALVVRIGAQTAAPQTATRSIAGRVVEQNGGAVGGVAVSLGGQPLKTPQTATTAADGTYLFSGIPDGAYTLSFRRAGFAPLNRADIVVAGAALRADVKIVRTASTGGTMIDTSRSGTDRLGADQILVRIQTKFGDVDIAVDTKRAPITAANFLKYVDAGLYDGGRFNRATRPDNYNTAPPNRPMMELIQGGLDPAKRDKAFPAIPLERTSVTGITHSRGIVSMARGGPDSATSEFFILLDDQPSLDFGGKRFDDNQGAAAFGYVIAGLDVAERIQQQPVNGQNLTPPVAIISVKRLPR